MNTIDTRGMLCPQPLIETRKALKKASTNQALRIISDNETSKNNILRFLNDQKMACECKEDNGIYTIVLQKSKSLDPKVVAEAYCSFESKPAGKDKDYVVVISNDKMGEGNDDLGSILMKGFLNAIIEQDNLPSHMIFYNMGIFLASKNSAVFKTLQKLEEMGVQIIICGTCVDYYDVKSRIRVGVISNMFDITEIMANASHILKP